MNANTILKLTTDLLQVSTWSKTQAIILATASLITASTVIYHFVRNGLDKINKRIREEARVIAVEAARTEQLAREQSEKRLEDLMNKKFNQIEQKLDTMIKQDKEQIKKQDKMNDVLQKGHIETWKNDFRSIYYNLRDTGNITDAEKSYADKIYHLYKEMGGNSDIDAKYAEMVTVFTKRLQEKHDERYNQNKDK